MRYLIPIVALLAFACDEDQPSSDTSPTDTTPVDTSPGDTTADVSPDCGGCGTGLTCCASRWDGDRDRCVDLTKNPEHCGQCGQACETGACRANACVPSPSCDQATPCGDGFTCSDFGGQGRCCPDGTEFTANISSFFGCCPTTDECGCLDGACPISRPEHKVAIREVPADELQRLGEALLATRLYTWRYEDAPEAEKLGFLIDADAPPFAVLPDGERVDLYGYVSLAVAAIKQQRAEVESLRARLETLERRLETLERSRP